LTLGCGECHEEKVQRGAGGRKRKTKEFGWEVEQEKEREKAGYLGEPLQSWVKRKGGGLLRSCSMHHNGKWEGERKKKNSMERRGSRIEALHKKK